MLFFQGQKAELHLDTNGVSQSSQAVTAPPSLQPFFDDMSDSKSQSSFSSLKVTSARPALPSPNISFHPVTLLTLINLFFSFFFSFHLGRKRKCVCLMIGTHSSLRPPLNPTSPHLLNAPKYVHQRVFVSISVSLGLLYFLFQFCSFCV